MTEKSNKKGVKLSLATAFVLAVTAAFVAGHEASTQQHSAENNRGASACEITAGSSPHDYQSRHDVQVREIGQVMPDGTIYAGISPDTGEALYVTSQDAPLRMTWMKATAYADDLDAHGHKDWRLPTKDELRLLYENRHKGALRGTFNEELFIYNAHWYWSRTDYSGNTSLMYNLDFTDGDEDWVAKNNYELATRPVRMEMCRSANVTRPH